MIVHGTFEAYLGTARDGRGVVLYDVSDELPRHRSKRYAKRELSSVRAQYVHHSGAMRKGDPFMHMRGSARYDIEHHGWPGFAYHFWHPHFEVLDKDGNLVIYRGNPDDVCTYHAGHGPNQKGIAHVLQGNLTKLDMSGAQLRTLPVALKWLGQQYGISPRPIGHFQVTDGHAKATCPGRSGKGWVLGYQAGRESRRFETPENLT